MLHVWIPTQARGAAGKAPSPSEKKVFHARSFGVQADFTNATLDSAVTSCSMSLL